ncbi:MAG: hypothetical protein IJV22_00980 [Bacteroidales bacterium]|nr:hypothetical protein [Bacteroidales bacterium]
MPMFYTPRPRGFHYTPRFYDPQKEEWENIKRKHGFDKDWNPISPGGKNQPEVATTVDATEVPQTEEPTATANDELDSIERRLRALERENKQQKSHLTLSDLLRRREVPQFNYTPRFQSENTTIDSEGQAIMQRMRSTRIHRRFETKDERQLEPVPAGKIMLYALLATLLLMWILL